MRESEAEAAGGGVREGSLKVWENPPVPRHALDPDAVQVIRRLRHHGHEAYLVGGCVRDLLLRRVPKDYDIATAARPREIKALFRNCRIIGRRFKLAHLHFGRKILEVSTFRSTPVHTDDGDGDLLIRMDNEFGTAAEDARRRDFTVNGLFYDPGRHRLLDWVGGVEDVRHRRIRTIGDPRQRFREDPVRILRAVKFSTRLGLQIETPEWAAMAEATPDLIRSAPPRVLEEILRLLRSGAALPACQLLRDLRALEVLVPVVGRWLGTAPAAERELFWRHLEILDTWLAGGAQEPGTAFLLAVLMVHPVLSSRREGEEIGPCAERLIQPFAIWGRLSRLDRANLKRLCVLQARFAERRRKIRVSAFVRNECFQAGLELLHLRCLATGQGWEDYQRWREKVAPAPAPARPALVHPPARPAPAPPAPPPPRAAAPPERAPAPKPPARERRPAQSRPPERRREAPARVSRAVVPGEEAGDTPLPDRVRPEGAATLEQVDEERWGDW